MAALDLEIRGAGNLLGGEQSGHIEAIGFEMYMKLLEETIRELKGEDLEDDLRSTVNLKIDLRIDEQYIPDMNQRLSVYRRIAAARSEAQLADLLQEVRDRYGPPPASLAHLEGYARIRIAADRLRLESIDREGNTVLFKFREKANVDPVRLMKLLERRPDLALVPPATVKMSLVGGLIAPRLGSPRHGAAAQDASAVLAGDLVVDPAGHGRRRHARILEAGDHERASARPLRAGWPLRADRRVPGRADRQSLTEMSHCGAPGCVRRYLFFRPRMTSVSFSLSGIGSALGRICLDNVACAERLGLSEAWMRRRIGIDHRFLLGEGETLLELATKAAQAAMTRAGRTSVDAIVATTLTDADKTSTLASRIGTSLGLKPALATDLSAGHASFPAALLSGIGLLGVGLSSVLVVSADSLGTAAIGTDPHTALIFSDGAGAALIERDGPAGYTIHAIDGGVDASRASLFAVRSHERRRSPEREPCPHARPGPVQVRRRAHRRDPVVALPAVGAPHRRHRLRGPPPVEHADARRDPRARRGEGRTLADQRRLDRQRRHGVHPDCPGRVVRRRQGPAVEPRAGVGRCRPVVAGPPDVVDRDTRRSLIRPSFV